MKNFMLFIAIFLALSGVALAANTPTRTDTTVSVVLDGSTDFDLMTVPGVPSPVFLVSITVKHSAANDYVQVRSGSATGAIIYPTEVSLDGSNRVLYYDGVPQKPYIANAECHFGTPANALVTFIYQKR